MDSFYDQEHQVVSRKSGFSNKGSIPCPVHIGSMLMNCCSGEVKKFDLLRSRWRCSLATLEMMAPHDPEAKALADRMRPHSASRIRLKDIQEIASRITTRRCVTHGIIKAFREHSFGAIWPFCRTGIGAAHIDALPESRLKLDLSAERLQTQTMLEQFDLKAHSEALPEGIVFAFENQKAPGDRFSPSHYFVDEVWLVRRGNELSVLLLAGIRTHLPAPFCQDGLEMSSYVPSIAWHAHDSNGALLPLICHPPTSGLSLFLTSARLTLDTSWRVSQRWMGTMCDQDGVILSLWASEKIHGDNRGRMPWGGPELGAVTYMCDQIMAEVALRLIPRLAGRVAPPIRKSLRPEEQEIAPACDPEREPAIHPPPEREQHVEKIQELLGERAMQKQKLDELRDHNRRLLLEMGQLKKERDSLLHMNRRKK